MPSAYRSCWIVHGLFVPGEVLGQVREGNLLQTSGRTNFRTRTAARAKAVVNDSAVVLDGDGTGGTGLFALLACNAGILTSFAGICTFIVAGAEDSNYSFFSAHAANTFSICVFFSLMMRNAWLTLSLTTWSLINCWTRIYLGMHYPSDILVGLIWGGVSGYIAYYVYKNIKRKTTEQDITDKFRYSQRDILPVTTIIAATLVFAIIYAAI